MATDILQNLAMSLTASPSLATSGRVKRAYRCRHCARNFKRSEHCARHERVHTQEKPFPCAFCDRKYARKDLVKRHERTLHAEKYRAAHPEEFGARSMTRSEINRTEEQLPLGAAAHSVSPKTPSTDITLLEESSPTELGRDAYADAHIVQIPYVFVPPSSTHSTVLDGSMDEMLATQPTKCLPDNLIDPSLDNIGSVYAPDQIGFSEYDSPLVSWEMPNEHRAFFDEDSRLLFPCGQ